eukprot:m.269772 g.269772  ORF g.269772 m.269772 type:complete len:88 (-) comp15674_c0_seq23:5602-5865(-)
MGSGAAKLVQTQSGAVKEPSRPTLIRTNHGTIFRSMPTQGFTLVPRKTAGNGLVVQAVHSSNQHLFVSDDNTRDRLLAQLAADHPTT